MKKTQKRHALLMSALSLLLCVSMLVGTTFAWFTDEVVSGMNIIAAGNLDIELLANGVEVNSATKLFSEVENWEPGVVVYENLQIANVGSLALKYQMSLNFGKENTLNGHKLSEVLQIAIVDPIAQGADRAAVLASVQDATSLEDFTITGSLTAGAKTEEKAVVIFWAPGENDNWYNANNGQKTSDEKPLSIEFGVKLFATQKTEEKDSFDHLYDDAAAWTGEIDVSWYDPAATEFILTSPEDLAGFAAIVNGAADGIAIDSFQGKTVKLGANLDLNNIAWTPIGAGDVSGKWIGFNGIFDGQNHTIYNLKVTKGGGWNGLFGLIGRGTTSVTESISNLTVKNVTIEGANRMTGGIVGQIYGNIENCHVENVTISAVPNWTGTEYDNGDKIGGIVGWHGDNGNNHYIKGCTAEKVTLKAYRDVAGIAGYIGQSSSVTECAVNDIFIAVDQITNHYGVKDANAGGVVGRIYKEPVTVENNTEGNVNFTFALAAGNYAELTAGKGYDGDYVLTDDIEADNIIRFGDGTTASLDLGGQTITAGNPGQFILGAQKGGKLVINGEGTVDAGKGFYANKDGAEIVVNGGTYNTTATTTLNGMAFASLAQNNSTIVINDGVFTTNVDNAALFMATSNARIEINGGFFENTADKTPDLLQIGTNKSNTNRIVITGGTFVNYNPLEDQMCYKGAWPAAGEAAFGGPWILIPGDYQVVSETQANGDIWYSVVAK